MVRKLTNLTYGFSELFESDDSHDFLSNQKGMFGFNFLGNLNIPFQQITKLLDENTHIKIEVPKIYDFQN